MRWWRHLFNLERGTAGRRHSNSLVAPISGVVTGFTLKKSPGNWTPINLRVVTPLAGTSGVPWRGGAASGDVVPSNAAGTESFGAQMPVTVGDFIGFDLGTGGGFPALSSTGGAPLRAATPSLPPDGSQSSGTLESPSFQMLAQYRVEPDADGDGFGDETQDKCPTSAKTQAACAKKCKKKKRKGKAAASAKKKKKCKKKKRKK